MESYRGCRQWQARLVEREQQWTQARAAAEQQWQATKAAAEQQWQQQLAAVQESHRQELVGSESAAGAARGQLEARVGAITERLLHMARHEAKRERRRGGPASCTGLFEMIPCSPHAFFCGVATVLMAEV